MSRTCARAVRRCTESVSQDHCSGAPRRPKHTRPPRPGALADPCLLKCIRHRITRSPTQTSLSDMYGSGHCCQPGCALANPDRSDSRAVGGEPWGGGAWLAIPDRSGLARAGGDFENIIIPRLHRHCVASAFVFLFAPTPTQTGQRWRAGGGGAPLARQLVTAFCGISRRPRQPNYALATQTGLN